MFKVFSVSKEIGGKVISIETGRIARQAQGAVTVKCGDTMVLATSCVAPSRNDDADFFPLSVDYREKLSAAGKFPGGFMKREGRPSTKEILTARMVDRPIRPLFPDGYYDEVQVLLTVVSADTDNDPDVLAMIAASAALSISRIPFQGPIGACRLSLVDGEPIINPTYDQRQKSTFNLILAGRQENINMIEVDAKQTPEQVAGDCIETAHKAVAQVCELINELVAQCGVEKEIPDIESPDQIASELNDKAGDRLRQAYQIVVKADRSNAVKQIKDDMIAEFTTSQDDQEPKCSLGLFYRAWYKVEKDIVQSLLLEGKRPDGRAYDQVRPLDCQVGLLPRAHGSALFTRGETQALVSVTLGTGRDEQTVDGLLDEYGQDFMLHYNFPPSSVGEVKPVRGPGRREIGHGALAEKALEQVKPDKENFPYTIKLVSDITESNGSSSMASVCGGCLALLDAGVPLKEPVAGISVGMIKDDSRYELLTDIIGDEDHFGHMDFKVAGSKNGITAIQLDIKAEGLDLAVMRETLERAKTARMHILGVMAETIAQARTELSEYAPKIVSIKIDPEYIGKVIGPSGKMVRSIQEDTGAVIEIEEDGTINISCVGGNGHLKARDIIESMTTPPKVGKIYENSKVISVKDFGVFVEISPGVEGLCHISELSDGYVKNVEDVCKEGDIIPVKLISIDDQGRFKFSRKAALADMEPASETE